MPLWARYVFHLCKIEQRVSAHRQTQTQQDRERLKILRSSELERKRNSIQNQSRFAIEVDCVKLKMILIVYFSFPLKAMLSTSSSITPIWWLHKSIESNMLAHFCVYFGLFTLFFFIIMKFLIIFAYMAWNGSRSLLTRWGCFFHWVRSLCGFNLIQSSERGDKQIKMLSVERCTLTDY